MSMLFFRCPDFFTGELGPAESSFSISFPPLPDDIVGVLFCPSFCGAFLYPSFEISPAIWEAQSSPPAFVVSLFGQSPLVLLISLSAPYGHSRLKNASTGSPRPLSLTNVWMSA